MVQPATGLVSWTDRELDLDLAAARKNRCDAGIKEDSVRAEGGESVELVGQDLAQVIANLGRQHQTAP